MSSPDQSLDLNRWSEFTHSCETRGWSNGDILEEYKTFRAQLRKIPHRDLVERGWISSEDDRLEMGRLFFSSTGSRQTTLFRKTSSGSDALTAIWCALVRQKAQHLAISQNVPSYESVGKSDLRAIAELSVDIDVIRELPQSLARSGIILVYLQGMKGMRVDGVAFSLPSRHMVIGMSFRFSRVDYFWFTLMHELAHLVLHEHLLDKPVLIDIETECDDVSEKAANALAKFTFVDKATWRNCEAKYRRSNDAVIRYAQQMVVHPSIVAGLLRREMGNYSLYNDLVTKYDARAVAFGK